MPPLDLAPGVNRREHGTTIGRPISQENSVDLDVRSPWSIDSNGDVLFDPAGFPADQAAVLCMDADGHLTVALIDDDDASPGLSARVTSVESALDDKASTENLTALGNRVTTVETTAATASDLAALDTRVDDVEADAATADAAVAAAAAAADAALDTRLDDVEAALPGKASTADITTLLGLPRQIFAGRHRFGGGAASTLHIDEAGGSANTGGVSGTAAIELDPARHAVTGKTTKLTLRAFVAVNATAPGCDFTLDLATVTGFGGATSELRATGVAQIAASVVAFTSAELVAGAHLVREAEFTFPAAGVFVVRCTTSGTVAAASSVLTRFRLSVRNV